MMSEIKCPKCSSVKGIGNMIVQVGMFHCLNCDTIFDQKQSEIEALKIRLKDAETIIKAVHSGYIGTGYESTKTYLDKYYPGHANKEIKDADKTG